MPLKSGVAGSADPNKEQNAINNQKKVVDQLRREAGVQRAPISDSAKALFEFCEANMATDPMLNGDVEKVNPFQEKKTCSLI